MNLATGPFDMLFNHGGWREFLEASGPHLALMILCGVGLMVILWGTAKERPGLVLLGLSLGGLPLLALIACNVFRGIMALLLFLILIAVAMVYSSMSAVKKREELGGDPAVEYTKINEDGSTHTLLVGRTAYGAGHVLSGGHKPVRVVEAAQPTSSPRDQSGDSAP
ncbi:MULTISPECIES: hypothetical protein [Alcaligenes]|uniref:hypothetical protein n=1 Tax=Alcaligenes TaxID=507 RepID=UPI001177AF11|nr:MULTISPECIES: hypothetical protein [Alcaligenes]MCM2623282.1 hypothetical protein [Alcaligenes faecalis]MCX5473055.1 hypothetical protein [Alcaligenes nematophilus]